MKSIVGERWLAEKDSVDTTVPETAAGASDSYNPRLEI